MSTSEQIAVEENKVDVIIIGAGLSGMIAAHTLLEKDPTLDVLILEATGRIGGRTMSMPLKVKYNSTCPFDLGAHWVSGSQTHILKYVTLLKLHLTPQRTGLAVITYKNGFKTFETHPFEGNILTRFEVQYFFAELEEQSSLFQFGKVNEFMIGLYDTVSMEEYIESRMYTKAAKDVVKSMIRQTIGLDSAYISPLYYFLICNSCLGFSNMYMNKDEGAKEFWIKEGADEICKRILRLLDDDDIISFLHPVTEVISYKNYIKVVTPLDEFYTSQVICSAPPEEVLNINFVPELSRTKKQVLTECNPGHVTKFILTYKQPFWRQQGYSGEIFSTDLESGPVTLCMDATKEGNPALNGNGTYKNEVIKQLTKIWGKTAEYYTDYKEVNWWHMPYVGGCPSTALGIGTLKWYHTLYQPLGRIHWAGAETATEWCGFMNGAVQSGYRAAINTLYDMRPQIITSEDMIFLDSRRTHRIRLKRLNLPYTYAPHLLGVVVVYLFYRFVIKKLFWE